MKIKKCPSCKRYKDCTCKRCGKKWTPRIADVKQCPKCKSARWYESRKQEAEAFTKQEMPNSTIEWEE